MQDAPTPEDWAWLWTPRPKSATETPVMIYNRNCDICNEPFTTKKRKKYTCSSDCSIARSHREVCRKSKEKARAVRLCTTEGCENTTEGRPVNSHKCVKCYEEEVKRRQACTGKHEKLGPRWDVLELAPGEKDRLEDGLGKHLSVAAEVAEIFIQASGLRGTREILDENDEQMELLQVGFYEGTDHYYAREQHRYSDPEDERRDACIHSTLRLGRQYPGIGCYGSQRQEPSEDLGEGE